MIVGYYFTSNRTMWTGKIVSQIGDGIFVVLILDGGQDAVMRGDYRIVSAKDMHDYKWVLYSIKPPFIEDL